MPRFAANLTLLFTELPMLDRFEAAAEAGFDGVEILYPYDIPAADLSRAATGAGLEIAAINCPPPNWAGGPRGFAAIPGLEARFRTDFDRALRFAQHLRSNHIHIMAGRAAGEDARQTFVENLRWACKRAPHASLTIKPMSATLKPGYFLTDFDEAARIINEVGAVNLGLQFDTLHAQTITGDAKAVWRQHRLLIRHIQIAGYPSGAEPFAGKINYPLLFDELDHSGYRGWISARYEPKGRTEIGLGWLPRR